MARTGWRVALRCPNCFVSGEAVLSRSLDGPADVKAEYIPVGFMAVPKPSREDGLDIFCRDCATSARRNPASSFFTRLFRGRGKQK